MNIPKFGSFKPKVGASIPTKPKDKDRRRGTGHEERKNHRRPRSRSKSRERDLERLPERTLSPAQVVIPDVFVVDRKGDAKNLIYGSVHRYSIPPFHRFGAGSVLGTLSHIRIDRVSSDEKSLILVDVRLSKSARSRDRHAFSQMDRPRLLKIRPNSILGKDPTTQVDFISLHPPNSKKRKRTSGSHPSSSASENEQDYRSIHGNAKSSGPLDEYLQYVSESDESGSGTRKDSSFMRLQNAELSRKVEAAPGDIEAWLELIAYQDRVLQGDDEQRRITNAERSSTAEVKIHMYEKALKNAKTVRDRERLLQGLMVEGSKIWEVKHQSEKWEQISTENIDSLLLWKSYLNFKQTTFSTFRYEELRAIYLKRIKLLTDAIVAAPGGDTTARYQQLVYILLRFTSFVRESGYIELAVAIWQTVLEINFRSPSSNIPGWKKSFEDFWDSESPRFGEKDSLGWRHYQQESGTTAEPHTDVTANLLDEKALFSSWTSAERLRTKSSQIPAKTMDDVVEDDPFRVILFSDIEDILVVKINVNSEELKKLLVDAFVYFCRLNPPSSNASSYNWCSDAFIRAELLELDSDWIKNENSPKTTSTDEEPSILAALPTLFSHYQNASESLFSAGFWFKSVQTWRDVYPSENGPVDYGWVRNAIKQLLDSYYDQDLAELYLAFEWRNEPESIKKTAKAILKNHSDCLRLYNAYALIEWSRGNKETANGVFAAALTMSQTLPEDRRTDSIFLWKSWVWACIEAMDNDSALKYLLSIPGGVPDASMEKSPSATIRATQYLISNRDYLISTGDLHRAIIYAECLMLLAYLSSPPSTEPQSNTQGNISTALSTITTTSQTIIQRLQLSANVSSPLSFKSQTPSSTHELPLQSASRLLFHHARTGPFRPALLRQQFTHFLTLYPHNTIFLSLYAWNESRLRIDRRVRDLLLAATTSSDSESQSQSLPSHLFKISWELQNGTIHSAKASFESALASPAAASSPAVWKLYMVFAAEKFGRKRAKDVWFRALRACPWVKELYIAGFEIMCDVDGKGNGIVKGSDRASNRRISKGGNTEKEMEMGFEELKSTWRVMGEKELRVHVDLEEAFEELEELE